MGDGSDNNMLKKEILALRQEVDTLKGGAGWKGVIIGGLSFHTKEDMQAWLVENILDAPFGSFVNFFSLLQQVDYDWNGGALLEDTLKGLNLRIKLDFAMNGDMLALASLRNAIPTLLGHGTETQGMDQS